MNRTLNELMNEGREMFGSKENGGNPPWHLASKADEALGQAYRDIQAIKQAFDNMHEIPSSFRAYYSQISSTMQAVGEARKDTYQLREMTKREAARV